jgi:hypothetical protein
LCGEYDVVRLRMPFWSEPLKTSQESKWGWASLALHSFPAHISAFCVGAYCGTRRCTCFTTVGCSGISVVIKAQRQLPGWASPITATSVAIVVRLTLSSKQTCDADWRGRSRDRSFRALVSSGPGPVAHRRRSAAHVYPKPAALCILGP